MCMKKVVIIFSLMFFIFIITGFVSALDCLSESKCGFCPGTNQNTPNVYTLKVEGIKNCADGSLSYLNGEYTLVQSVDVWGACLWDYYGSGDVSRVYASADTWVDGFGIAVIFNTPDADPMYFKFHPDSCTEKMEADVYSEINCEKQTNTDHVYGGHAVLTPCASIANACTEACRNLSYLPNNIKELIEKGVSKADITGICTNGYDLDTNRAADYQWGKNSFITFLKNSNIISRNTPSGTIWSPQVVGFSDDNLNGENYCYETKTSRDHNLFLDFGAHDDCACYVSGNCVDQDTDGYGDYTSIPWSCEKGGDDCWDYSDTNFNFKNYPYVFEDLDDYKKYFIYGYVGSDRFQDAKDTIINKYKEIYNKISSTKLYSAYVNPGVEEGKDLYPDQILKLTYGSLVPGINYIGTTTTGSFFLSACKGGIDEDCDGLVDCYDSGCYDSQVCTDSCGKACNDYAKSIGKTSSGSYCAKDENEKEQIIANAGASAELIELNTKTNKKDYKDCPEIATSNTCVCKLTKEGTCDAIYGAGNWVPCPSGTTDPTKCCPSTPKYPKCTCCEDNEKAEPNCCTDSNEICVGYDKHKKNINFCSPFVCPTERPVQCLAKDYPNDFGVNWCCETGDECSLQTVISILKISIKNPICVRPEGECNANEKKCENAKPDKGVLCCDKEKEECNDISDAKNLGAHMWICTIKKCDAGKQLCLGRETYKDKINLCCNTGEMCTNAPNGYPMCVPELKNIPIASASSSITGNVILGENINESEVSVTEENGKVIVSTYLKGFFELRNPDSVTENGKAFHIYSENGELETPVEFSFDEGSLKLYYYEEGSINDCIDSVVSSEEISLGVYLDNVIINCQDSDKTYNENLIKSANVLTDPVYISLELWKVGNITLKDTFDEIQKSFGIVNLY